MQRRPVVAALLALVPALGHAYLRRWARGIVWLLLISGSVLIAGVVTGASRTDPTVLPPTFLLPIALVVILSAVDAFLVARRERLSSGPACPYCGKEVDSELRFCWYCASPFEETD